MTNVTIQTNDLQKRKVERVAEAYNCSQSAAGRHLFEQRYNELFGDIHPDALDRHDVDVDALIAGDDDPDEIDDDLKMDGDGPAQIPAADGGAVQPVQPTSYTPTYTPADLATSGPHLEWDELKDAINEHWSDTLEIHPDRVYEGDNDGVLKQKPKYVARILAALLRSENDTVTETKIHATILRYTSHQIDREPGKYKSGEQYKKEKYGKLVKRHFVAHPETDTFYTSKAIAKNLFPKEVEATVKELVSESRWVLDPREHAQRSGVNARENAEPWLESLAEFRQKIGFLNSVLESETWAAKLEEIDGDRFEEFYDANVAVRKTYNEMLKQYVLVNEWARFAVGDAILELEADDVLEDEILKDDRYVTVNADKPMQPAKEWVQDREGRLSHEKQIDVVSEKI